MAHFANIDENNKVIKVIVVEQNVIDKGVFGDPSKWIQTSYNTHGGKHYDLDGNIDDGIPMRYNYAASGDTYDPDKDAFISPKPYPSWVLNETTCMWEAPVPCPPVSEDIEEAGYWWWNEEKQEWELNSTPKL